MFDILNIKVVLKVTLHCSDKAWTVRAFIAEARLDISYLYDEVYCVIWSVLALSHWRSQVEFLSGVSLNKHYQQNQILHWSCWENICRRLWSSRGVALFGTFQPVWPVPGQNYPPQISLHLPSTVWKCEAYLLIFSTFAVEIVSEKYLY